MEKIRICIIVGGEPESDTGRNHDTHSKNRDSDPGPGKGMGNSKWSGGKETLGRKKRGVLLQRPGSAQKKTPLWKTARG